MEGGKIVNSGVFFAVGLVVFLIIGFTIIVTLADVESDLAGTTTTLTVTNETGAYANLTDTYTVAAASYVGFNSGVLLTGAYNATSNLAVATANLTMSTAGVLSNATAVAWEDLLITYTYSLKETEATTENLRNNLTSGVNNISNKLPTIFLIAVIVMVLAILLILWMYYKRMDLGSGSGSGSFGKGSSIAGEL